MVHLQYVIILQNYGAKLFVSKSQYTGQHYRSQATIYVKVRVLFVSRMKCIYAINGASVFISTTEPSIFTIHGAVLFVSSTEQVLKAIFAINGVSVVRLQYRTTNHNSWCSIVRLNYRTSIERYLRNQWCQSCSYQLFNLSCGMVHFKYENYLHSRWRQYCLSLVCKQAYDVVMTSY